MKRILFVDDDPLALAALENMTRKHRRRWEMVFCATASEAIAQLHWGPFDAVVSDLGLGGRGVDGDAVLNVARQKQPGAARIVLSGQMQIEAAYRALPYAHQWLSKPCEAHVLQNVIDRACGLGELLGDPSLRALVGEVTSLPPVPRVYQALVQCLSEPSSQSSDVAAIIEQDVAICAKTMQLANSSFFGPRQRISNVHAAVTYLGTDLIKSLVLAAEVFGSLGRTLRLSEQALDYLHDHAMRAGQIARQLLTDKREREDACVAALLHDVGKLLLASKGPEIADEHHARHAHVGAYLLGIWGLPYPIVEAVAHHHTPMTISHERLDVLDAVYVADALAAEIDPGPESWLRDAEALDEAYCAHLGILERVHTLRATLSAQAQAVA